MRMGCNLTFEPCTRGEVIYGDDSHVYLRDYGMATPAKTKTFPSVECDASSPQEGQRQDDPCSQWRGGYDCEFVDRPPSDVQWECPICHLVVRDPHQAPCCGKTYCRACTEQVEQVCPTCNHQEFSSFPDKRLWQSLREFEVNCHNHSAGCKWTGQLGELETHLNLEPTIQNQLAGCQFVEIKCRYCFVLFERRHIEDHQLNNCPKRPFTCDYCDYNATYEEITQQHHQECPSFPVRCPNDCELVVLRGDLEHHMSQVCPIQKQPCQFRGVGCQVELLRKDQRGHEKECVVQHSVALSRTAQRTMADVAMVQGGQTKMQAVIASLQETVAAQGDKIERLEHDISYLLGYARNDRIKGLQHDIAYLWHVVLFIVAIAVAIPIAMIIVGSVQHGQSEQNNLGIPQGGQEGIPPGGQGGIPQGGQGGFCTTNCVCGDKHDKLEDVSVRSNLLNAEPNETVGQEQEATDSRTSDRVMALGRDFNERKRRVHDERNEDYDKLMTELENVTRSIKEDEKRERQKMMNFLDGKISELNDKRKRRVHDERNEDYDKLMTELENVTRLIKEDEKRERQRMMNFLDGKISELNDKRKRRVHDERNEDYDKLMTELENVTRSIKEDEKRERQKMMNFLDGKISELNDKLDREIEETLELKVIVKILTDKNRNPLLEVDGRMLQVRQNAILKHLKMIPHEDILPFEFTLKEFGNHKFDDEIWFSPPFYTHINGYKMCIRVDVNGRKKAGKPYISISAYLMAGVADDDLTWPFRKNIKIELINQAEGSRWNPLAYFSRWEGNLVRTFDFEVTRISKIIRRVTSGEKAEDGLRILHFISHDEVMYDKKGAQYLKDDSLKFRVSAA